MTLSTIFGLFLVTGGSTFLGSVPVIFHHYFKESSWNWWESFGGGVMVSASFFSLFFPALKMVMEGKGTYSSLVWGIVCGLIFIFFIAFAIKRLTQNIHHQRAFMFVFVMALHNIPEGLAVGVDVAALGWRESAPLTVAIFIQNLPEGLASSMSFLIAGFSVREALLANGITAIVEALSAYLGFIFVAGSVVGLPFLLMFSGACMLSVVAREAWMKIESAEAASISPSGFIAGLFVCGALDFLL